MERSDYIRYSKQVVPIQEVLNVNIVILILSIIHVIISKHPKVKPFLTPTIKVIHAMYFNALNVFFAAQIILAIILCLAFCTYSRQLFNIFFNYEYSVIYGGSCILFAITGITIIAYIDESFNL